MIKPVNSFQDLPHEFKYESIMERVINHTEQQKEKTAKEILKYGIITAIVSFLLGIIFQNVLFLTVGFISCIVIFFSMASDFYDSGLETYRAGLTGEQILRDALRQILSSESTVFYNLPIPYGDIDTLVVSPYGVYVFEVKHHNGYIKVNGNVWERVKVGAGGTIYAAPIKNPELQAKRNAVYVKNILKQHGIDVWVNPVVVFTNPEVKLRVENNHHVFHITEVGRIFSERAILSEKEIEKIKTTLAEINSMS